MTGINWSQRTYHDIPIYYCVCRDLEISYRSKLLNKNCPFLAQNILKKDVHTQVHSVQAKKRLLNKGSLVCG